MLDRAQKLIDSLLSIQDELQSHDQILYSESMKSLYNVANTEVDFEELLKIKASLEVI